MRSILAKLSVHTARRPGALAVTLAAVTAAACGATTPVNYSDGTRWEIPMVAPLEGVEVVVPVTIGGKGPYLFALAPDAQVSLIDHELARGLNLYTRADSWRQFLGAGDDLVARRPYEVLALRAGDLTLRNVIMWSTPASSLTFRGQPLHGLLGADVLTRTIVLDIDRDRGVVTLALTGHEQRPEGATRINGRIHSPSGTDSQTLFRKLVVPARLDGARQIELAVDLSARTSQVFPDLLSGAGSLELGGLRIDGVSFAPLGDRRIRQVDFAGLLGQDVLARYHVVFDPDDRELWLAPRDAALDQRAAQRLSRWGDALSRCPSIGCVDITVASVQSSGHKMLRVSRTAGAPAEAFEVVLQGVDASGRPLRSPLIRMTLSPGATPMAALGTSSPELSALADAVGFHVIDASLHVPACSGAACVAALTR